MSLLQRHFVLAAFLAVILAFNAGLIRELVVFALHNSFSSHIVLVPFIAAALILRGRSDIFAGVRSAPVIGIVIVCAGLCLSVLTRIRAGAVDQDYLALHVLALVTTAIGGFVFTYGFATFRAAIFPLLFLLFAVPIPEALLKDIVLSLQKGTAYFSAVLFDLTGTPYLKEGLVFLLPRVSVEIAPQCSGIRSSLALLITCLLAGHILLKGNWRRLILVLVAVPMAMFKNAVRVVGLSLLAIHVDMRFLTSSNLHSEGGILFYILALVLLAPLVWFLRRGERKRETAAQG